MIRGAGDRHGGSEESVTPATRKAIGEPCKEKERGENVNGNRIHA